MNTIGEDSSPAIGATSSFTIRSSFTDDDKITELAILLQSDSFEVELKDEVSASETTQPTNNTRHYARGYECKSSKSLQDRADTPLPPLPPPSLDSRKRFANRLLFGKKSNNSLSNNNDNDNDTYVNAKDASLSSSRSPPTEQNLDCAAMLQRSLLKEEETCSVSTATSRSGSDVYEHSQVEGLKENPDHVDVQKSDTQSNPHSSILHPSTESILPHTLVVEGEEADSIVANGKPELVEEIASFPTMHLQQELSAGLSDSRWEQTPDLPMPTDEVIENVEGERSSFTKSLDCPMQADVTGDLAHRIVSSKPWVEESSSTTEHLAEPKATTNSNIFGINALAVSPDDCVPSEFIPEPHEAGSASQYSTSKNLCQPTSTIRLSRSQSNVQDATAAKAHDTKNITGNSIRNSIRLSGEGPKIHPAKETSFVIKHLRHFSSILKTARSTSGKMEKSERIDDDDAAAATAASLSLVQLTSVMRGSRLGKQAKGDEPDSSSPVLLLNGSDASNSNDEDSGSEDSEEHSEQSILHPFTQTVKSRDLSPDGFMRIHTVPSEPSNSAERVLASSNDSGVISPSAIATEQLRQLTAAIRKSRFGLHVVTTTTTTATTNTTLRNNTHSNLIPFSITVPVAVHGQFEKFAHDEDENDETLFAAPRTTPKNSAKKVDQEAKKKEGTTEKDRKLPSIRRGRQSGSTIISSSGILSRMGSIPRCSPAVHQALHAELESLAS